MTWYLDPSYQIDYLTDSIQVRYNKDIVAWIEFTKSAQIRNIFVAKEHRQKGIGHKLVSLVEQRTGVIARPMPPVSELGRRLFENVSR